MLYYKQIKILPRHSSKHWTENNIAQPKKISYFASHLIFHHFPTFNCSLGGVLKLDKEDYFENLQIVCLCLNKINVFLLFVF